MYVYILSPTQRLANTHARARTRLRAYTDTHTHTGMHTYTHTHTHTDRHESTEISPGQKSRVFSNTLKFLCVRMTTQEKENKRKHMINVCKGQSVCVCVCVSERE